jgi:cytochrome c heme-lyase
MSLSDAGEDARNLMPTTPANAPSPGQENPLPTARQASSIPMAPETELPEHQKEQKKEGTEEDKSASSSSSSPSTSTSSNSKTWIYPSQQMFFNAMRRKGWSPDEQDMASVVAIHNAVNERAWQEVVAWESAAGFGPRNGPCGGPRLAKFVGRPKDLSPKARFLNLLGYRLPFDRHDWFVDRCGKERVRYVIDFYNAAPAAPRPSSSSSSSSASSPSQPPPLPAPVSMHLDVRPALDSPGAAWERLKAAVGRVASR